MSEREYKDLIEIEMDQVRERLKWAIKDSGMSVDQVATKLGLTRLTVQRYLNGSIDVPMKRFFSILYETYSEDKYYLPDRKLEMMTGRIADYDLHTEIENVRILIENEKSKLSADERLSITHSFLEIVTELTKPC